MSAVRASGKQSSNSHPSVLMLVFTSLLAPLLILCALPTAEAFTPIKQMSIQLPPRASTSMSSSSTGSSNIVDELMIDTYNKLATRLMDRYEKDAASNNSLRNNQLFVCIAGGPGSGKSTLATAVVQLLIEHMRMIQTEADDGTNGDNAAEAEAAAAVVLPMDGFHYSRSQLQSMGESPHVEYNYEQLLARRGSPWTFDAEGCIEAFTKARTNGQANLPIYSRLKSDPVENGVQLHPETKIVLLEGNYLLAWDDERWAPLQTNKVFDETWYIACKSLEEQRERLVNRHLETWSGEKTNMWGEGSMGAGAKADANDMLNLEWIEEMSRKYADLVIESV